METIDRSQDPPDGPVGQSLVYEQRTFAFVDLGRDASAALRASWSNSRPFASGGVIDSTWLEPVIGAGSTAASSLLAGNVFLATANPATLMTIGTGVGSAVMGPTGIVATAPFVAASSALVPVVAPVMLFLTISSVAMAARIERAQRTFGRLFEAVERIRIHLEAEDYARVETAAERIDEIRSEFEHSRRFAKDAAAKLALVEHDVSVLVKKYGHLVSGDVHSEDQARQRVTDLWLFFLASLYDLEVDVLQLYWALQNDPDVAEVRSSWLMEKIERYGKDFRQCLEDDPVGDYHRKLKQKRAESWRPDRRLAAKLRNVRAIRKDYHSAQAQIKGWIDAFEANTDESQWPSIVLCRDRDGERELRAYHTRDIRLERAAA